MQKIDDTILEKFTTRLLFLIPDFPLSTKEIHRQLAAKGLERFLTGRGGQVAALAETAELIERLEKGGLVHGGK